MQAQAMFLETNLAGSSVFEYGPNSKPERCKYNYLYFFLCGFCSLWQHSNFKYVFYSYKFQKTWTSVKTAQYNSLGSPNIFQLLYKKQDAVICYLASRFKTKTSRCFFCEGKVPKHKSLFITENISSKPKLMYKWFLCYRKKSSHYLVSLRIFS